MSPDDPDFRIDYFESIPVARLAGDLDVVQSAKLRERLLASVRNEDTALVVDLTEVRYIDSSGVNVMFELAERLAEGQIEFGVVVPEGGLVERVLQIVDLRAVAAVHRSADEAVGEMRAES